LELDTQRKRYAKQLKSIRQKYLKRRKKPTNGKPVPNQGKTIGDKELIPPTESVFTTAVSEKKTAEKEMKPDRKNFEQEKGLHVGLDYPTRYDLEVRITEVSYKVETLTDWASGESVRASLEEEGPPKFSYTWKSISNLIKLHVGFAIPTNRIALMLGHTAFTSGKICRVLEYAARLFCLSRVFPVILA